VPNVFHRGWAARRIALRGALFSVLALVSSGAGAVSDLPRLYTNQDYQEDVRRSPSLDVDDIKSVLRFVLGSLPARVKVYPTENYYYFYFYEAGVKYAGNFRFDVDKRDAGEVEFIYFKETTEWAEDETDHHATLGPADGVDLKKAGDLVYDLAFEGRTVTFELNDLSAVRPPDGILRPEERFLGPVADESGIRFYLVFDPSLKVFHYVLDESGETGDELIAAEGLPHILIGRRTGFAFFRDDALKRKVLVGVYGPNVDVNNYFDGPFDQLPDNFLQGDELRQAILAAMPEFTEPLDRLGIYSDGDTRVSISPYLEYLGVEDLAPAEKCAGEQDEARLNACLGKLDLL
jgi:hypothetical protein